MTYQDAVSIAKDEGCKAEIHADRIVFNARTDRLSTRSEAAPPARASIEWR